MDMKKILTILFLAISSVVSATTYYVSSSGKNANNGLTTSTPWQTVQYAEAHATNAGDIIALKKGDIWLTDIALGIHHGGVSGNPIIWDGALWGTGANAIIRSACNRISPNLSVVNIIGCSYVTFRNISVDGNNTYTFGLVIGGTNNMYSNGGIQNAEKYIIVQNCSVLNCGNGVSYALGLLCQTWNNGISDITIKGNTFNGADDEQLAFYGGKTADGGTPAQCKNVYIGYNTLTNWGRRGQSTGYGLQINNKITDVIIENNILTTGPNGHGNGLHIESNESVSGAFPERITVRYNKISATVDNTFCIYITQGQAKTVDVYCNLLYSSTCTATGGGIWVVNSTSPSWTGAKLNFYNNTVYSLSGRSFTNGCTVEGVVTLKNNLFYNKGNDDYGMMCLVNNTAGTAIHSNNLYYRSTNINYTKIKDGGSYKQTPAQVLAWETGAVAADPLFKTPGTDFHLQAGSPGKGAGIAISGITKDIDGVAFSNPPDIGCYQSSVNQTAPVYIRSVLNESAPGVVEMTYDQSLANVIPAVSTYNVQVNSVSREVSSVTIAGQTVNLTLASPVTCGETVTVSYAKPALNPLQSVSGGLAANISAQLVTNNLITVIPPVIDPGTANIKIIIYPNPVHHILNISCEYTSSYSVQDALNSLNSIRIIDMSGKLVLEKRLEPGRTNQQIPINLKSGVFIVLLISRGLTISSQKLVVYN
jgi:uncharacterized repeat protein (TIGR02059 family)